MRNFMYWWWACKVIQQLWGSLASSFKPGIYSKQQFHSWLYIQDKWYKGTLRNLWDRSDNTVCLQSKTVNNPNVHQKQNGPIVNSYDGISYAGFLPFASQISLFTKQGEWVASSILVKGLLLKKWDILILRLERRWEIRCRNNHRFDDGILIFFVKYKVRIKNGVNKTKIVLNFLFISNINKP